MSRYIAMVGGLPRKYGADEFMWQLLNRRMSYPQISSPPAAHHARSQGPRNLGDGCAGPIDELDNYRHAYLWEQRIH